MRRPLLFLLLLAALVVNTAAAQIERNLESRTYGENEPQHRPRPVADHATPQRLSPAQVVIARGIARACTQTAQQALDYQPPALDAGDGTGNSDRPPVQLEITAEDESSVLKAPPAGTNGSGAETDGLPTASAPDSAPEAQSEATANQPGATADAAGETPLASAQPPHSDPLDDPGSVRRAPLAEDGAEVQAAEDQPVKPLVSDARAELPGSDADQAGVRSTEELLDPGRRPDTSRWNRHARERSSQEETEPSSTGSVDTLIEHDANPQTDAATEATNDSADHSNASEDRAPATLAAPVQPAGDAGGSSWLKPGRNSDTPGVADNTADQGTQLDELALGLTSGRPATPTLSAQPQPPLQINARLAQPATGRGLVLALASTGSRLGAAALPPLELALPDVQPQMPPAQLPANLSYISRGNPKQKLVALTFDDGPHPDYTSQLLAVLGQYDVPATFFFVGLQAQKYPQWVKMAHQAGHEIGSHTYDHFRLPKLPPAEQAYQIDEYQRLIEGLVGVTPRFLRPPGGQMDDGLKRLTTQRGMVVALWDVALNDTSQGKTSQDVLKTAVKNCRPGSIILAHDGVQATIDMLPTLIETLHKQGYRFVTMSELAASL
jgi:peptidoglycan-N-acetylglucosamine deacetylase